MFGLDSSVDKGDFERQNELEDCTSKFEVATIFC